MPLCGAIRLGRWVVLAAACLLLPVLPSLAGSPQWQLVYDGDPLKGNASRMVFLDAEVKLILRIGDGGMAPTFWALVGDDWRRELIPLADLPAAVNKPSMAYDSIRGLLVRFGGYGRESISNETWEYDGQSWAICANQVEGPDLDDDDGRGDACWWDQDDSICGSCDDSLCQDEIPEAKHHTYRDNLEQTKPGVGQVKDQRCVAWLKSCVVSDGTSTTKGWDWADDMLCDSGSNGAANCSTTDTTNNYAAWLIANATSSSQIDSYCKDDVCETLTTKGNKHCTDGSVNNCEHYCRGFIGSRAVNGPWYTAEDCIMN